MDPDEAAGKPPQEQGVARRSVLGEWLQGIGSTLSLFEVARQACTCVSNRMTIRRLPARCTM
jgi:hypothetical protein